MEVKLRHFIFIDQCVCAQPHQNIDNSGNVWQLLEKKVRF